MLGEADTAVPVGKTFEAYVASERQAHPEKSGLVDAGRVRP